METYTPVYRGKNGSDWIKPNPSLCFKAFSKSMMTYLTWGTSREYKSPLKDAPGGCVWAHVTSLLGHFISSRTQFCASGSSWDTSVWLQWILPAARCSAETFFPSSYWRRLLVKQQAPSCSYPLPIPVCHSTIPVFWVPLWTPSQWLGWDNLPCIKQKCLSHDQWNITSSYVNSL